MKTTQKTPKVNEVNEFIEIASDFEDPLEVIREALSNSYDAEASEISITITRDNGRNTLIINDDGHGMDEADLESFFDLGNSRKTDAIGYKGHGTKIYYKSDRIEVETVKDGTKIESVMDRPWEKLNNRELPTYSVNTTETDEPSGTQIKVQGFRAGQGFDPQKLTYNKIEHYIKWKTVGGSTGYFFNDSFHEFDINVKLDESIDDTRESLPLNNKLEFPDEQLDPDGEFVAEQMCKVYPPREVVTQIGREEITLQIVGMVGGKEARNELPTYGKHSAQFGVWLAKDHIKVERINDAVSADNEFFHFFFIVNCQALELSANREKIRNKSGDVYEAVKAEVGRFMTRVCEDRWYKEYIAQRKIEEKRRQAQSQADSVEDRRQHVKDQNGNFTPSNPAEVIAALERYSANGADDPISIADFQANEDVNAIVQVNGDYDGAALRVKLSDFFEEETALTQVDHLICWKRGDIDALHEIERSTYLGEPIEFDLDNRTVRYGEDLEKTASILELADHLSGEHAH